MERMLAARQDGLHKEGTKGEKGKNYSHCLDMILRSNSAHIIEKEDSIRL